MLICDNRYAGTNLDFSIVVRYKPWYCVMATQAPIPHFWRTNGVVVRMRKTHRHNLHPQYDFWREHQRPVRRTRKIMGRLGKPEKAVDWVTLMDELWTSDEEVSPKSKKSKVSLAISSPLALTTSMKLEASATVSQQQSQEETREKLLSEASPKLNSDVMPRHDGDTACLSEDPLSTGDHASHKCGSTSSHCSPTTPSNDKASQSSQSTCKAKQTDLLSYIDRHYSQASVPPLTDVQNVTCSESTDDGYTTLDNSRLECTPQLFLPKVEKKTELSRALFSPHKTTKRYVGYQ